MGSSVTSLNVLRTNGVERTILSGRFRPDTANDPSIFFHPGLEGLVFIQGPTSAGATGKFQLDVAAALVPPSQGNTAGSRRRVRFTAELQIAGPSANRAHPGAVSAVTSSTTILPGVPFVQHEIWTVDAAGAGANLASNSNTWIHWCIELEDGV